MPGDKLGKGVNDGDNRFAEIGIGHSVARHNARAPAILRPCVVVAERYLGMLFYSHLCLLNGTVRAVPFLITYLPDPTSPIYLLFHR